MPRVFLGIALLQFGILAIGLVRGKTLAMIFGPDGLGLLGAYDQLVVVLTQLGALGLPFAAMKAMAATSTSGAPAFNAAFSRFLVVMAVLATAATGVTLLVTFAWPSAFGPELARDPVLLRLAALGIFPLMMTIFIAQTLVAGQVAAEAAVFALLSAAVMAVAAISGALLNGFAGLYAATALAGYGFVAMALLHLKRKRGLRLRPSTTAASLLRASGSTVLKTAFAIFCVLVGMSASLLATRLIVLSVLGAAPAGLLQSALATALSVGSVVAAIIYIQLAPSLNRDIPVAAKFDMTGEALGYVTLLLCLGAIPIMLFPQLTLHILYSRGFSGAATTLVLCVFWQAVYQVLTVFQQLMIALEASLMSAAYLVAGFVAGVLAVELLVPPLGLVAAPLGLVFGACVSVALHAVHLWVAHRFRPPRASCIRLMVIGTVAAVSALGLAAESELNREGFLMRLALALIALVGAVFAGSPSERKRTVLALARVQGTCVCLLGRLRNPR